MKLVTRGSLYRLAYPAFIGVALLGSAVAFTLLGPVVGIKSTYVFLGLLLSGGLFYTYHSTTVPTTLRPMEVSRTRVLGKSVFVLVLLAVTAVPAGRAFGIETVVAQMAVLLFLVPAGYLALALQFRWEPPAGRTLAQILALFSVTPIVKYQSTGFYASSGDTPGHVYLIEQVVSNGTWQAIPTTSFYHYFPGLHTMLGSMSTFTGLSPYDVYMLAGIATYCVVIAVAYLFARLLFDNRVLPLCIALAMSLLLPIITHASYFYPQALAVAVALVLLLLSYRGSTDADNYWAYMVLAALLVGQLWVTHHLTVVLFVPVLVALLAGPRLVSRFGPDDATAVRPVSSPLVVWVAGSVAYWLGRDVFIAPFVGSVVDVLSGPLIATGSGDETSVVPVKTLGQALPESTVGTALLSVFSPSGIYNLLLVCTVSFAAITVIYRLERYRRVIPFLVLGVGGSLLLLRTPLVINGLDRTHLPLSIFIAFLLGIALFRLLPNADATLSRLAPVLVVFLFLTTSATLVASPHVYELHSGPDLWEGRPLPEEQIDFSQREMRSFEQSSTYLEGRDAVVASDWRTQIGLERYGTDSKSMRVRDGQVTMEADLLMYRSRWPDHSLRLIPGGPPVPLITVVVDKAWLDRTVRTENKVYTTGEVGMLADRSGGDLRRSPG